MQLIYLNEISNSILGTYKYISKGKYTKMKWQKLMQNYDVVQTVYSHCILWKLILTDILLSSTA